MRIENGELRIVYFCEGDGGIDLVCIAGEDTEHSEGFGFVMRFAEHVSVRPDDGIRRDEELVRAELFLIRARLRTRYIIRNITCLKFGRTGLIGVYGDSRERDAQTCKQFAATRRCGA